MCQHEIIASSEICRLERCPLGRVVLSVGPVSLRLEREAFTELTRFLAGAADALQLAEATVDQLPVAGWPAHGRRPD